MIVLLFIRIKEIIWTIWKIYLYAFNPRTRILNTILSDWSIPVRLSITRHSGRSTNVLWSSQTNLALFTDGPISSEDCQTDDCLSKYAARLHSNLWKTNLFEVYTEISNENLDFHRSKFCVYHRLLRLFMNIHRRFWP